MQNLLNWIQDQHDVIPVKLNSLISENRDTTEALLMKCSTLDSEFPLVTSRKLVCDSDDGEMTSDTGVLRAG